MDNGPEFIAKLATLWSQANKLNSNIYSQVKPSQNAYIERFNRTYRRKVLDDYLFDSLDEVRDVTDQWVYEYNHLQAHIAH